MLLLVCLEEPDITTASWNQLKPPFVQGQLREGRSPEQIKLRSWALEVMAADSDPGFHVGFMCTPFRIISVKSLVPGEAFDGLQYSITNTEFIGCKMII